MKDLRGVTDIFLKKCDIIKQEVCRYREVEPEILYEKTRRREIVETRQIVHYFVKRYVPISLEAIGYICGKLNHCTVLHSCKTIEDLVCSDKNLKFEIDQINEIIKNKLKTEIIMYKTEFSLSKPITDVTGVNYRKLWQNGLEAKCMQHHAIIQDQFDRPMFVFPACTNQCPFMSIEERKNTQNEVSLGVVLRCKDRLGVFYPISNTKEELETKATPLASDTTVLKIEK